MTDKPVSWGRRALAAMTVWMMVILLLAGLLLTTVHGFLTRTALHESVAIRKDVVALQKERVARDVTELAEQYHFSPETVLERITTDKLEAYNRQVIAWWTGIFRGESAAEAPVFATADLQNAVLNDPLFQEYTEQSIRLRVARDEVAYRTGELVREAVLPIRLSLVELAVPLVMDKVNLGAIMSLVMQLGYVLLGLAAAASMVLLAAVRFWRHWCTYMGSAAVACALVLVMVLAMLMGMHLPDMAAELSAMLAMQLDVLERTLSLRLMMGASALAAVGLLLRAAGRLPRRRSYSPRHRQEV